MNFGESQRPFTDATSGLGIARAVATGMCVGFLATLLPHLRSPSQSDAVQDYLEFFDLYLWPTHLLAMGPSPWGVIAIATNVFFFGILAFAIHRILSSERGPWVVAVLASLWSLLIATFLAGFEIRDIHWLAFVSGLAFYLVFAFVIRSISQAW